LLLVLVAAGALWYLRPDPRLAHVRQLRQEMAGASGLPANERRERWNQLRQEVRQLSPEQRRQLRGDRRLSMQKELQDFFKLSKEQRVVYLDARIDRAEAARKERDAARAEAAANGTPIPRPPGPQGRGRGGTEEEREQRRKEFLDRTTPEQRALMAEFRKEMADRREQRGLPPNQGPRR
jgi:hypothetical protein